ncbi:MAG: radical SAM/SPASM domain-containing protein [Bacilli bacterium]|jgi:radical SAM protein with 4Fe4S-binding SPASM domain|nr:radical SAM/SPASM domain-containing protein [Bacilli bacterium]MDD3348127.1 radical SAM/SPASM domain-containing protein [Bacilli bacterium]MDD4056078.1 radical SAM/SPASM domain-containing protein [Bacilli bacterium]MDY0208774.1 radical SAM/SPASM domain-containing protein [Bacilli bacterium]
MKKQFKKIYIEISNICNLKCPFCSKTNRKKLAMTAQEFSAILKQVKEYSDYIYLHVKGEPIIHPQFMEILSIAAANNIKVNITTNGVDINKVKEGLLNCPAIHQVNISLHSLVCLSANEKDKYLDDIYEFIDNVSHLKSFFVSLRLWIKNEELNKYILNYLEMKLAKKIIIGDKSIIDNVYISSDEEFVWPSMDLPYLSDVGRCLGTRDQIAILTNGDVVPCCLDAEGIIKFGNIFDESLTNILAKPRFLEMKKGFENGKIVEELCQKCSYRLRFEKN